MFVLWLHVCWIQILSFIGVNNSCENSTVFGGEMKALELIEEIEEFPTTKTQLNT